MILITGIDTVRFANGGRSARKRPRRPGSASACSYVLTVFAFCVSLFARKKSTVKSLQLTVIVGGDFGVGLKSWAGLKSAATKAKDLAGLKSGLYRRWRLKVAATDGDLKSALHEDGDVATGSG